MSQESFMRTVYSASEDVYKYGGKLLLLLSFSFELWH